MILPDINLLVRAYNEAAPAHGPAAAWWRAVMDGEQAVGIPWATILGFVRIVTHPAVLVDPLRPEQALHLVRTWLERPQVRILEPGSRHLEILAELFEATGVAGSLTTDAHLAAIAIEHQAELHSNDHDFARFPGLRHRDPLR